MTIAAGAKVDAGDFTAVSFTPVWTGVTLGTSAINEGWYLQVGNLVHWGFRTQFGTAPAFTATVQLTLPVAAWVGGGTGLQATLGVWTFRDTSATTHYSGSIGVFSSAGTSASFAGAWSGTVPSSRIAAGAPVTVAVDDVLSGSGTYRIA